MTDTVMATGTGIVVMAMAITMVATGIGPRGGFLAQGWQSVPVQQQHLITTSNGVLTDTGRTTSEQIPIEGMMATTIAATVPTGKKHRRS